VTDWLAERVHRAICDSSDLFWRTAAVSMRNMYASVPRAMAVKGKTALRIYMHHSGDPGSIVF
ncbi:hypothetical protein AC599_20960, partial [Yersinia pestis subsp. microtus bv. Altaica]